MRRKGEGEWEQGRGVRRKGGVSSVGKTIPHPPILPSPSSPCRPAALRVAASLLSSPLPPITQPNSNAPVEVKVLAAGEEAAFEGVRGMAAW